MKSIRKILEKPQSKINRDTIVDYVINDPQKIDDLMDCFFDNNNRLCQNASWPMTAIGEKKPDLIIPYIGKMLLVLENKAHNSVVRNIIRFFQTIQLPEEYEGAIFDKCFEYLNNTKEEVAVRVFSMSVLSNLAMKYPELKEELIISIEMYYSNSSPSYKSRAKKELLRLKK